MIVYPVYLSNGLVRHVELETTERFQTIKIPINNPTICQTVYIAFSELSKAYHQIQEPGRPLAANDREVFLHTPVEGPIQ
jgi:hypothetical protein